MPGSSKVALGWMLSALMRCKIDEMVNQVLEQSAGVTAIAESLGQSSAGAADWTSCEALDDQKYYGAVGH